MHIFYNKTVTIWNRALEGIMQKEAWYPTVIKNARLIISRGNNILSSGNSNADTARLFISDLISSPSKSYVPDWQSRLDKEDYFTLNDTDTFFTEGDTSGVICEGNLMEELKKLGTCYKVTSVDRFELIPHWEVFGK